MDMQSVSLSLHDESEGYEISPARVPMAVLRNFTKDVDDFLKGESGEIDTASLAVSVVHGSIGIRTEPIAHAELFADLRRLSTSALLDGIDVRRRKVVERWQKMARSHRKLWITVSTPALAQPLVVSASTDFRADDADQWVRVERYLQGEVVEMGGTRTVNAHIRLPDGRTLIAESSREVFRSDKVNRLYKVAMARIAAEYNVVTREYRDVRLLAFEEHHNALDEASLARLTERGAKAWKDVPSASSWVDGMRGNKA
ncbi:MAG: hypothetical protein J7603_12425 [Pseudacidovorax sp.]|nr:hypothetical protein [Pseudacidovorax sp.]